MLKIDVEKIDSNLILKILGDLVFENIVPDKVLDFFKKQKLDEGINYVILDVRKVENIDKAGFYQLYQIRCACEGACKKMKLLVGRLFDIDTGSGRPRLSEFFEICHEI